MPVAENCLVDPLAMLGLAGEIVIDASVAGVTVSVAVPDKLPEMADMIVVPEATEVASPLVPAIVATDVADELQVTEDVMSFVLSSG